MNVNFNTNHNEKFVYIYKCIKYYLKKLTNDGMTYYLFN